MTDTITALGFDQNPVNELTMPKDETPKPPADVEHLLEEKTEPVSPEPVAEPTLAEMLKAELSETRARLLRLAADFENYKKISQREQQTSVKFANAGLITDLLPIVDNLEQAVLACKKSTEASNNDVLVGVEMVVKQLAELLRKSGVEIFSAVGQPFDPARHEAMGEQISDTVDHGFVVEEYQKGYLLHGRLLRPARVVVAKRSGS